VLPHIAGGSEFASKLTPQSRKDLLIAMSSLKQRAKTLVELVEGARFIIAQRPLSLDPQATAMLTDAARALLRELLVDLEHLDPWTSETTEQAVRAFAQRTGVKLGQIAQPLRASLTGRTTSPPVFEVLSILGRRESLARIEDQLAQASVDR
jgi:glutamyl-tRNA synthetase